MSVLVNPTMIHIFIKIVYKLSQKKYQINLSKNKTHKKSRSNTFSEPTNNLYENKIKNIVGSEYSPAIQGLSGFCD